MVFSECLMPSFLLFSAADVGALFLNFALYFNFFEEPKGCRITFSFAGLPQQIQTFLKKYFYPGLYVRFCDGFTLRIFLFGFALWGWTATKY